MIKHDDWVWFDWFHQPVSTTINQYSHFKSTKTAGDATALEDGRELAALLAMSRRDRGFFWALKTGGFEWDFMVMNSIFYYVFFFSSDFLVMNQILLGF